MLHLRMPGRRGTAARSVRSGAARGQGRRRPGSAGWFPRRCGARGLGARPGCAGAPTAGNVELNISRVMWNRKLCGTGRLSR
jgi:hypothetical protein